MANVEFDDREKGLLLALLHHAKEDTIHENFSKFGHIFERLIKESKIDVDFSLKSHVDLIDCVTKKLMA